ncbi:hypothetical protein ASL11_35240 [Paenibacillus sp. Soil750]|nr:hypothetical protein ASL11_35240 [Paenibacillus sp. Soil750]
MHFKLLRWDCSPLPKERDSIYLNFYRLFRDTYLVAVNDDEVQFSQKDAVNDYYHNTKKVSLLIKRL